METRFTEEWLRALAAALTERDGKPWHLSDDPLDLSGPSPLRWRAILRAEVDGDEAIYIAEGKGSRRANISGVYPPSGFEEFLSRPDYIEINVSRDRSAADIATDIVRRLLPGYRDGMARRNEDIAQATAQLDELRVAAERMGIGARRTRHMEHEGRVSFPGESSFPYYPSCLITVASGSQGPYVGMNFRGLSVAQADALLAAAWALFPGEVQGA